MEVGAAHTDSMLRGHCRIVALCASILLDCCVLHSSSQLHGSFLPLLDPVSQHFSPQVFALGEPSDRMGDGQRYSQKVQQDSR